LEAIDIRDAKELDAAFSRLDRRSVSGLLVIGSAYTFANRAQIAALAIQHRLPTINAMREATLAGGLMSYGPVVAEQFCEAAVYIDRILKGTRPSELPVQQPARFELVVNRNTAKRIGVTVPNATVAQADEVIR
jgi:putative ABC transport system substrate-binding protein